MIKYIQQLQSMELFENMKEHELEAILSCLTAKTVSYKKDSVIFLSGDEVRYIGIVLSGIVQVVKEDNLGNKTILAMLSDNSVFGETFACAGVKKFPVTVLSITECEILFLDYRKIITTCSTACTFHTKLIENMLKLIAGKNLLLNQKIELISKRSIRDKLLSYFALQIDRAGSHSLAIPLSRQELADFLCVDRSALSRELCKMRDEGLLEFHGNMFKLYADTQVVPCAIPASAGGENNAKTI